MKIFELTEQRETLIEGPVLDQFRAWAQKLIDKAKITTSTSEVGRNAADPAAERERQLTQRAIDDERRFQQTGATSADF